MEISMSIMLSEYYLFLQGSHMLKHIADKNYKYTIEKSDILIRDSYQKLTYFNYK